MSGPDEPWRPTVVALLRHLADVGFAAAPRVVGDQIEWVPGDDAPACWSDEAGTALGVLLRDLHRATASFVPPPDAVWQTFVGRSLPGSAPVVGHGDTAPWNVIARDAMPVVFIDWERAGPFDATWELAHTAWLNARLHDDDIAERDGLPDAAARARLLAAIVDGYGAVRADRAVLVDRMVEFAVLTAREDALEGLARGVEWRVRSAAWMVRHGPLLRRALGA